MDKPRMMIGALMLAAAGAALAQPPADRPCAGASGVGTPMPGCSGSGPHARWGKDDTPGWSMMTPQERQAHRNQMSSFSRYEDCMAYADRHHAEMEARAKARGRDGLPARRDACAPLKGKTAK